MFDKTDIRAAIEAGAISDEGAKRFEAFLKARNDPDRMLDAENLRFLSNFNDVFLTIGIVVLMTGLGFLSAIGVVQAPYAYGDCWHQDGKSEQNHDQPIRAGHAGCADERVQDHRHHIADHDQKVEPPIFGARRPAREIGIFLNRPFGPIDWCHGFIPPLSGMMMLARS